MVDLKKNVNLEIKPIEELGVEVHDNEHEDQDYTHQDNQDSIDKVYTFEQENQDSTHQDNHNSIDKDSTLDQEDENNHLHSFYFTRHNYLPRGSHEDHPTRHFE
jgi:hypothetical protein